MVILRAILRWVIQPFCTTVIGMLCLELAHRVGWYPELQLTSLVMSTPDAFADGFALWLLALTIGGAIWFTTDYFLYRRQSEDSQSRSPSGLGGRGGDAKVSGSGIAVGGPGGHAGKYGRGGDGGGANVAGDGLAAGGAGGSAGDDGIWRPPAKSGYEVSQRALGLPIDPNLRQFGRGGAMPGYEPKLQMIEELRAAYFKENGQMPQTIFESIKAVPLDYLNTALAAKNEAWRARIVDDEYEFFILSKH